MSTDPDVWPHVVWAVSMCAMTAAGVMFRYLPREDAEHAAVARGLVGGVGMVLYALALYWWHFLVKLDTQKGAGSWHYCES